MRLRPNTSDSTRAKPTLPSDFVIVECMVADYVFEESL